MKVTYFMVLILKFLMLVIQYLQALRRHNQNLYESTIPRSGSLNTNLNFVHFLRILRKCIIFVFEILTFNCQYLQHSKVNNKLCSSASDFVKRVISSAYRRLLFHLYVFQYLTGFGFQPNH